MVRAYSASALGAIEEAKIITYDLYTQITISISYSDYQKLSGVFEEFEFRTDDTDFGANVEILGRVTSVKVEDFSKRIVEVTSGRSNIEILGEKFDY